MTLLLLAVGLFVSTNVDDLFVLLAFFSDPRFAPRQVVAGQFLGIAVLVAVSIGFSLLSLVVAPAWIGLLGLVPIGLGLHGIVELWGSRAGEGTADEGDDDAATPTPGRARALAIAGVTIANGGDNLSIYTPVFAARSGFELAVIAAVFAAMTAAWLGAAFWLTRHRALGAPIRRHGRQVLPFVLVGLGAWILVDAGTIALVRSWWGG